ncbi:OmpR family two-component system response regulator [Sphingobium sp. SYK-6]|uniref:response regulator n=1 Tax=Sphingobium sp. (strain NBRC 103272 / SYK-6) TaxID=627192 RepID=UPI00022773AB|nr:response regulator [Sphingobium sp. SYK-6]BAK65998.1 OmpR family two-component system response regulator [Sphingobium sp. SYK-6]
MSPRPHLLLVDDETAIREPLGAYLQRAGFRVSEAPNAAEARRILASSAIELVVLDIMMPGEDGLSLCRSIREQGELPVILLTARTEETDRIVGLEMGADDYVLKPFSPRELVARIKTILRRAAGTGASARESQNSAALYRFEGWTLRADDWTLTGPDEVVIPLSTADFRLLHAFVTHPRQVLSRDQLLDLTQGREAHAFDRSIDNQISRLRRKLEDDARSPVLIKTVWGGGYMFSADVIRE